KPITKAITKIGPPTFRMVRKAVCNISNVCDNVIFASYIKPFTRDSTIKYQPSTRTNNNILNGNETITGDNINIPIDINTLANTISIIKNGIKIKKPMVKAVLNSLIVKAGTIIVKGNSSGVSRGSSSANSTNNSKSVSLVWVNIKDLIGS